MSTELENALARELQEVADGVRVPTMPALRFEPARPRWVAPSVLAAAAVVLVIGVVALLLGVRPSGELQPAPAPVSPSPSARTGVDDAAPRVPYVLGQRLVVDGQVVDGDWWTVTPRGGAWLALRTDGTWWWGRGPDAQEITGPVQQAPVLSPGGRYLAYLARVGATASLSIIDVASDGAPTLTLPPDTPATEQGVALSVAAVTDAGQVVLQGPRTRLLRTGSGDDVDLAATAPDQVVLQATAAGLVVVDGADGAVDATSTAPYLADLADDGTLTPTGQLPRFDTLDVSPGGTRYVRTPPGTLGGEVAGTAELLAGDVAGGDEVTLSAPDGGTFGVGTWAWEDDESLVAVVRPGSSPEDVGRPVRCDVVLGECRVLPASPDRASAVSAAPGTAGTTSAAGTLDAVLAAAAAADRASLGEGSAVVADAEWTQLVDLVDGASATTTGCRDNGSGTRDCEIALDASPGTTAYAILGPAGSGDGWRITYVGVAEG